MLNFIYCRVPWSFLLFLLLNLTLIPVFGKRVVQYSFSLQTGKEKPLFACSVVGVCVFLVEQGETWN